MYFVLSYPGWKHEAPSPQTASSYTLLRLTSPSAPDSPRACGDLAATCRAQLLPEALPVLPHACHRCRSGCLLGLSQRLHNIHLDC